ncbi:MAG TPA: hypothetical protein VGR35_15985 [Tepidisphaeraceae bacterium]|nr:hypothetical protein [Tepidisphaeraceae bacterium]
MVQGEWIVALTRPDDTFNEETGRWEFNVIHNRGTTPSESLAPALEAALEMGIKFKGYIGSEDAFVVKVPDGMSYQQLLDVMDDLPEFQYVEPNGIMRGAALPFLPDVPPEEAKTEEPIADKPDVTNQPAVNRFVMPARSAFSQDRIGSTTALDADDDDDDDDDLLK